MATSRDRNGGLCALGNYSWRPIRNHVEHLVSAALRKHFLDAVYVLNSSISGAEVREWIFEQLAMCDFFPGQLIVCFPKVDAAAREIIRQIQEKEIEHVTYVESIDTRLARLDLPIDPMFEFELHLLAVPPGQETWKTNYLQFFYEHALLRSLSSIAANKAFAEAVNRSNLHFTV